MHDLLPMRMIQMNEVLQRVNQGERNEDGEKAIVFAFQYILQGEIHVRRFPLTDSRNEWWRFRRPIEIRLSELVTQEELFRKHDAFIVKPKQQTTNDTEPCVAYVENDTEPHEEIPEIERVSYGRVDSLGVEHFSDLTFFGVSSARAFRGVSNGDGTDELSEECNRKTDPSECGVVQGEIGVPLKYDDHGREYIKEYW